MPLIDIMVKVCCDQCGGAFAVTIDAAITPAPGWSTYDLAVDAVRGGQASLGGSTSVQEGKLLCASCTQRKDQGAYTKAAAVMQWLAEQRYQGEKILPAILCGDTTKRKRMIEAIAELL